MRAVSGLGGFFSGTGYLKLTWCVLWSAESRPAGSSRGFGRSWPDDDKNCKGNFLSVRLFFVCHWSFPQLLTYSSHDLQHEALGFPFYK